MRLVDENLLDEWCRGHRAEAQSVVVELVWRLLRKSAPDATRRRLPLGDSLNQPGADVYLETVAACGPFVPCGKSYWEIGIGAKAGDKAQKDYRELTDSVAVEERRLSTFVFVTPLSGVRSREGLWVRMDGEQSLGRAHGLRPRPRV